MKSRIRPTNTGNKLMVAGERGGGAVEMGEGSGSCRLLVMERMRGMEGAGRSATL